MQQTTSTNNRNAMYPWFIWLLGATFYFYENLIQVSPGVIADNLISNFEISSTVLGASMGFFYYSYTPMQIPVGVLVDNFNLRYLLSMATLSVVAGCLLFSFAESMTFIAGGRFLIGFGASFAAVCSMKIASNWFPAEKFPMLIGFMVTIGMFGSMTGEKPLANLVESTDWRTAMAILGGIGIVLSILIFSFVRHSPKHVQGEAAEKVDKKDTPLLEGLLRVIKLRQSWIVAIYGGMLFASTSIFGGLWGVPYFVTAYGLDKPAAANLISMLFLGWVFGSPLSGFMVKWMRSHKRVLWMSSIGSFLSMSITLYVPDLSISTLKALMISFGFFSSMFLPSFTLMRLIHTKENAGAALGFMNAANMLGGAFGQPLIGALLERSRLQEVTANGAMAIASEGERIYSAANYQFALTTLPIIIGMSFFLLPFIKEKKPH